MTAVFIIRQQVLRYLLLLVMLLGLIVAFCNHRATTSWRHVGGCVVNNATSASDHTSHCGPESGLKHKSLAYDDALTYSGMQVCIRKVDMQLT
jgi:hypothetical protein